MDEQVVTATGVGGQVCGWTVKWARGAGVTYSHLGLA